MAKRAVKRRAQLSPQEKEELARLLIAPALVPDELPSGFVSSRPKKKSDVVARVKRIKWFANCGKPRDFDLTMQVERVHNWPDAVKGLLSRSWQTAILEAMNQLTMYLAKHHPDRWQNWSELGGKFNKEVLTPLKENILEPFRKSHDLHAQVVVSPSADVMGALMENAHIDCRHGCFFFLELLTVHEAGHLACGWRGAWPQGKLSRPPETSRLQS